MKLFASDFDGTFYFRDKKQDVFKENMRVVKEFQKENKFAIVTGRTIESIMKNIESYDFMPDYIAGFNGGIICDSKLNMIYEDYPQIDVSKIMNILKGEDVKSFSFLTKSYMFARHYKLNLNDFKMMHEFSKLNGRKLTYQLKKVENQTILMATVICVNIETAKKICNKISSLNMKCNAYMNNHCIDIVGVHSSKKNAVEIIRQRENVDEVYTIGDSYNDISMIEHYHGFTLCHANDDIKQVACNIVENVYDAIEMIHK